MFPIAVLLLWFFIIGNGLILLNTLELGILKLFFPKAFTEWMHSAWNSVYHSNVKKIVNVKHLLEHFEGTGWDNDVDDIIDDEGADH